ncbi:MAG: DUF541 domain-containing protein [Lachnospiraceae bacterium]|nr:DUF541 domain-containing protein [Lachnospiraceae bacterium]
MEKTIKIKGSGSMCFVPDWLELNITLESVDTSYNKAMQYHCEKIGKLIDAIESIGYHGSTLISIYFTTDAVDDFNVSFDREKFNKKGTKVTQQFKLGMPYDIRELEKVVHSILDCGIASEVLIIQTVSDKEALQEKLLKKVVKDSKRKAIAMARATGAKVGSIVSMEYKIKDIEYEGYISQEFFEHKFVPITSGYLFGYDFIPNECEAKEEIEILWELVQG